MTDNFYKVFEDKHRGSRELIKARLRVYLPFIIPLIELYPDGNALDLGCGRGEWLELMREIGISAQGVDLDNSMLQDCVPLGLDVQVADAITYLERLPDQSLVLISAFHLVEHISFDALQVLVRESFRVLQPAGLLILETPNPENIVVGSSNFYIDPTHNRPIPSQLLCFLPEYFGFKKIKICRLNEQKEITQGKKLHILDVLGGVSPDYSIVAQKDAPENSDILSATSQPFEKVYGLSVELLTAQYDQQSEQQDQRIQRLEDHMQQSIQQLAAMHRSLSWRLTAPFRWLGSQITLIRQYGFLVRTKALFRKLIRPIRQSGVAFINARPRLRKNLIKLIKRCGVYDLLKSSSNSLALSKPISIDQLTLNARAIYVDLNAAISKQKQVD